MRLSMWRRLKNALIYYFTAGLVTLVGFVPAIFVDPVGKWLGYTAHFFASRERRLARTHLGRALNLEGSQRRVRALARGVFVALGRSAVELCRLRMSPHKTPRVVLSPASAQVLDTAFSKGKGVIFVSGHLGNWELMAYTLANLGYPISTVARESYDPRFTQMIEGFRKRAGVESIYRGRPGSSAAMLRALKSNRVLGFLIDQDTSVPSAFVPFFGTPAKTPVGAAVFATRSSAPVVLGSIHRRGDGSHIIDIVPLSVPEDVREGTALLTQHLEARIRRHPTEWVWFHERWRTRPDAEVAA
jgi:KDO2-lipid IV(A) lauroyltransferase